MRCFLSTPRKSDNDGSHDLKSGGRQAKSDQGISKHGNQNAAFKARVALVVVKRECRMSIPGHEDRRRVLHSKKRNVPLQVSLDMAEAQKAPWIRLARAPGCRER